MKELKILVADDDQNAIKLMRKAFEKKGYQVATAEDGIACLRLYRDFRPNAVLIDFMMPNMDGLEVLKEIRKSSSRSQLPVLMITSRGKKELVENAIKHGISDFITKPVKTSDLVERTSKHFFQLEENEVRQILLTLNTPDAGKLNASMRIALEKQSMVAYPTSYGDHKVYVIARQQRNMQQLAKISVEQLEQEVTILAKIGFIWNAAWPDTTPSASSAQEHVGQILNSENEWLKFVV